jgi:diketogulonate reductase-like aldo/keto reductase
VIETATVVIGADTTGTDVAMPRIGLGFAGPTEKAALDITRAGIAAGYRSFDTGSLYGNERGIGTAMRESRAGRAELFVTTKLWIDDMAPGQVRAAAELSLGRLTLDVIDLYLIHWPAPALDLYTGAWRELMALRSDGLVRSIGVSNFEPVHLVPSVNQIEMHPYLQQTGLRELHRQLGIVTVAFSPLALGKALDDPVITGLAARYRVSPAQVILRWHLQLDAVPIPRSSSPARMRTNLDLNGFSLDEQDMSRLAALDRGQRLWFDPMEFSGSKDITMPRYTG